MGLGRVELPDREVMIWLQAVHADTRLDDARALCLAKVEVKELVRAVTERRSCANWRPFGSNACGRADGSCRARTGRELVVEEIRTRRVNGWCRISRSKRR